MKIFKFEMTYIVWVENPQKLQTKSKKCFHQGKL